MIFSKLSTQAWFVNEDGDVCQKLRPLNGSNTYNLTQGEWGWTDLRINVDQTTAPFHPVHNRETHKRLRTLHLFEDGTYFFDGFKGMA